MQLETDLYRVRILQEIVNPKEVKSGYIFTTPARTITEADIVNFSYVSGDFHPAVSDQIWSEQKSIFNRRIAHGLLIMSASEGLFMRTGFRDQDSVDFTLGFNNVKFPNPVFPGDTIHTDFQILEARESRSRPGSYIITPRASIKNQKDQLVGQYDHPMLFVLNESGTQ